MSYYINPDAILDNSIKETSLPVKVQEKVDLYHINKQKPVIVGRAIPRHPEEGNRYYFADGIIKIKALYSKINYYYFWSKLGKSLPIIFTIPKKKYRRIRTINRYFILYI